jgi:hypothetical protein
MNIIELLNTIISNKIAEMHICMPAKIISYDFTTRKASVQPSLNQKYSDNEILVFPVIHNVPVMQPSSGGASVNFPVKPDDNVLLTFSEKSLEQWLQDGKQSTPDDSRQNNLTDAVAHLGLNPFNVVSAAENNNDLLITYDGSKIKLKPGGVVDIVATTVNIDATNITVTGKLTAANLEATSEIKSATALIGGKDFATHKHTGVIPGPGITGPVS